MVFKAFNHLTKIYGTLFHDFTRDIVRLFITDPESVFITDYVNVQWAFGLNLISNHTKTESVTKNPL